MHYDAGWWIPSTITERRHPVASRRKGSAVIPQALAWGGKRRVVLQAGGHLGLWPILLAAQFRQVLTFEPDPENWACLCKNTARCDNIHVTFGALGERTGTVSMQRRRGSTGGHYVKQTDSGSVPLFTIDSLSLPCLDALFLDVEGYELAVVRGAEATLERCRPLLVCEENSTGARYGRARGDLAQWLAGWGYQQVQAYKRDLVFLAQKGA
jgi:FkbM family methyltransferase